MKILKNIFGLLVVIGLLVIIAAPPLSRVAANHVDDLEQTLTRSFLLDIDMPGLSPSQQKEKEDLKIQIAASRQSVKKHAARNLYVGGLCSLLGLAGLYVCLSHEVRNMRVPNKAPEHISKGRGRPSENAQR